MPGKMLFTSTASGFHRLRLPQTWMRPVSCPWPKPGPTLRPHCQNLFCVPLPLRRTATLHSFSSGNPAALRLSSSCCRPFSGSDLSALPSVRASLSTHPYSGPTAGSDRRPSHPLLTKQLLRDPGSSDSGHRTLALMGLYSSPGYVQAKNACFWWEICGNCGLPVDVIGKAGDFWGLPAAAKKTCIIRGAK